MDSSNKGDSRRFCWSLCKINQLLRWFIIATLTSANLHIVDAGSGGSGAVGNTVGGSTSGGTGSTTANNDVNELFNCTSIADSSKLKYSIKGSGWPFDNIFPLTDKKAYVFWNFAEWDCQGPLENHKNENLAVLLTSSCLSTSKDTVRQWLTSTRSSVYTLIIVRPEGKTKQDIAADLDDIKKTSSYIKGFIPESYDDKMQQLIQTAKTDNMTCEIGTVADDGITPTDNSLLNNFSRTSVLFVSVSFIILMVISLAWLVFYYVQRFRYAHAKDRLARRLFNAAKKALTKIPAKTLRVGDRELDSDCPVCIEPYHASDVIRILPCKHVFHKTCVDPWLLEHRTCPMCKMDILKAFGYNFGHSEESVRDADQISAGGQSTDRVGGFPVPMPTDSDLHDPFFPSPAPSPSLLQPVLHSNNTQSFSIIPLTVHNSGARGSNSSADSSEHWVSERHSAEVHRGALCDNSSAGSTSGSDDGHGDGRGVTQPLFRQARPSTSASAIIIGNSGSRATASLSSASASKHVGGKSSRRRKSTKSTKHSPVGVVVNNRPRSASSQNLGSSSMVVDPSIPEGRISCGLRNDAAPSLESL